MPRGRIYNYPTKMLHLNLPEPLHALLHRYAALCNVPASRLVASMLAENMPVLEATVKALEDAQSGRAAGVSDLNKLLLARIAEASELSGPLADAAAQLELPIPEAKTAA